MSTSIHNQTVTVSHSGKQHAYQHALSLQRLGMLDRFVTSTYYRRDRWPDRFARLVPSIDRTLRKRWLCGLDDRRVTRHLGLELRELWQRNVLRNRVAAENATYARDVHFDNWVADRFADKSDVFWGYQGSCLESLKAARSAGRIAICEFATAHVTAAIQILSEESEKHPEWASTISNLHFPDPYRERLEKEPYEADFCVAASSFTQRSLEAAGIQAQRIRMLPLAADLEQFQFIKRDVNGPLKVLFVGGIGQRKGIKYLLQAVKLLSSPQIQLQLLGPLPADTGPLNKWKPWFHYLGRTDQAGVANCMQQADVLVLPSVFEGFGLVILEAMATGLPVIASTHSCGPEVIEEGASGFVLRHDDVDGLAAKLSWCAAHRHDLIEMGSAAERRAKMFSWECHSQRLQLLLESFAFGRTS